VRPSHGRPSGHRLIVRPSVRPSVIFRVTTLRWALRLALSSTRLASRPAPSSSIMIWSRRFGKRSPCPLLDLPRPALPSGTLVSSHGSGRPSISELLDRCPFGPPTVALPYTYIKPSTPQLHHFLHSPIRIGTCDCVATAALRGSWSFGAGSNCWVQTLSIFFPQFT
jgi:hypothetical protein